MVEAIRMLTYEMFPGELFIEYEADPDDPSDKFLVFNVRAKGSAAELVDCRCAWHDRVLQLAGEDGLQFRLSIDPT